MEKTLMLGNIEDRRRMVQQKMKQLDGIIYSMDMSLSILWEIVKDREALYCSSWGHKDSDMAERLDNNYLLEDGAFDRCLDHEGGALRVGLVLFFTFMANRWGDSGNSG